MLIFTVAAGQDGTAHVDLGFHGIGCDDWLSLFFGDGRNTLNWNDGTNLPITVRYGVPTLSRQVGTKMRREGYYQKLWSLIL